jgi:hypothetical protein
MVIVNPLTSQILKSQMETSFKDYFDWRRIEGREEKLLEIRAIEFDNDEAYFLAGPVMFQGKSYGMAYFQHRPGCKPIAQQEEEMIENYKHVTNLSYMPYEYKEKFYKYLDPHADRANNCATEFFFDPETKRSFSALDLRFDGAREIDHKVITRGRKHSRAQAKKEGKTGIFCGAFWTTKIAEERIGEYIGKEAIEATIEKQLKVAHEINEENRNVAFCAERPYQLYLLGTDDTSFTKTFETLEVMEKFAQSIKQLGSRIVTSQMTFTN